MLAVYVGQLIELALPSSASVSCTERPTRPKLAPCCRATAISWRSARAPDEQQHWLRVFALVFRREAFLPTASDPRTFHQRALEEGRFYEQRVANNLSNLVFGEVFPELARAIAAASADAPLQEVREAALILLYRLLFILFAEDRNLLPVRDSRYEVYGLRERVRGDVARRKEHNDTFSDTAARYWSVLDDLCRAIDAGDGSIGLPPYNGGLFDPRRTPLLTNVRLGDAVMANVIDALSYEKTSEGRKYINYRDLSVQQLGSIYERLLEHEVVRDDGKIIIRPNAFARKSSGSYYTPDDLVNLILRETIGPLVAQRMVAFSGKAEELEATNQPEDQKLGILKRIDPADRLLELKVCDPAMGSGHFLVSLVDYLADQVITAMAEAEVLVSWGDYISPLSDRIESIRNTILANAEQRGWTIDPTQLDDRHIIRRMVLKRCVYGVDKNLMAVELAKVSLWLHTFTVGAPLSFLDHHLRCGDSLFGSWVKRGIDRATSWGSALLLHGPITRAMRAASSMQIIEGLTDAEIAEADRSADVFAEVQEMTAPLNAFLSFIHALDWLDIRERDDRVSVHAFFDGQFGDPTQIALGAIGPLDKAYDKPETKADAERFSGIFAKARELISEEHFLNWQVAFPGVWSDWEQESVQGGFDAIIGNPPWDRVKLQQVEWFAARRLEIATAAHAADRKRMIAALQRAGDTLSSEFTEAESRALTAARLARTGGDYGSKPLARGALYLMLQNRVYRGETVHKDKSYPGEHDAIVDERLWNEVQVIIRTNRIERADGRTDNRPSMLAGLLFDAQGERMSPSHANKRGTRYRYYVSRSLIEETAKTSIGGQRIPAVALEALIVRSVREWLADSSKIHQFIGSEVPDAIGQRRLIDRAVKFAATWNDLSADDVHAFIRAVTARIQVHAERIEVALDRGRLLRWLDGKHQDEDRSTGRDQSVSEPDAVVMSIPVRLRRAGKEMRLVVDDGSEQPLPDPALIRLVIRAHGIRDQLLHDRSLTLEEIAKSTASSPPTQPGSSVSRCSRPTSLPPCSAVGNHRNSPPAS